MNTPMNHPMHEPFPSFPMWWANNTHGNTEFAYCTENDLPVPSKVTPENWQGPFTSFAAAKEFAIAFHRQQIADSQSAIAFVENETERGYK